MSIEKLKKAIKEEKLSLGERETLRNIKLGKTKVIFMASNCKEQTKEAVEDYKKHSTLEVIQLEIDAEEVGIICKKQFPVAILSY
jgi:large subunit ribosomal protein L30e